MVKLSKEQVERVMARNSRAEVKPRGEVVGEFGAQKAVS